MYSDPVNYDQESAPFDPEGSILLALAAQMPGTVFELGCGTGRVMASNRFMFAKLAASTSQELNEYEIFEVSWVGQRLYRS